MGDGLYWGDGSYGSLFSLDSANKKLLNGAGQRITMYRICEPRFQHRFGEPRMRRSRPQCFEEFLR
jgi:hypothetical protein